MYKKKGMYVFPTEKDGYRIFIFDDNAVKELPATTYAKQIIDFTEIDMTVLEKIVLNARDLKFYTDHGYDYFKVNVVLQGNYYYVAQRFCESNPIYSFLLSLEMENKMMWYEIKSSFDYDDLFEISVGIIENMLIMQNEIRSLCYSYCEAQGSHAEKLSEMLDTHGDIFDMKFSEIFVASSFGNLVSEDTFDYPIKRGYYFDNLTEYLWFVFMNFMMYDVNFSECIYCCHFFLPATKKKTRYCDRMRTEDGKTCKQVGPPFVKKKMEENNTLLEEYSKAVARNYKRVERTENKMTKRDNSKYLDVIAYNVWLDKARHAKRDWIDKKITDDDFAVVIHELD